MLNRRICQGLSWYVCSRLRLKKTKVKENCEAIFWRFKRINSRIEVTTQVDRLKTVRKKRILKPCLMQESHSAKVLQACFSDPLSLNSFSLTTWVVTNWDQYPKYFSCCIVHWENREPWTDNCERLQSMKAKFPISFF